MNSYERFLAFVRREPMDRPLRRASFTPDLRERLVRRAGTEDLAAHFDMDDPGGVQPKPPPGYEPPDFSAYYADLDPDVRSRIEIGGCGVAKRKGGFYHFTERIGPLRNATRFAEIEEFPIETMESWDTSHMAAWVEERHAHGRIAGAGVGHIYENAWQIRGYEQFLTDMATRPEWCESILDRLTRRNLNIAVAAARAGADRLMCGDDVANQNALMFSPEMWRKFMKPRWAQVWAAAREIDPDAQIVYHSDGNIEAIVDDLIEIGVTILNPIQPECMDVAGLARKYKGRLLFDGGIGTQSVMPFGSPDDVRACVRERVAQFGQDLCIAPTHVLEPEVPIENIEAFFEACDEISFDG